MADLEYEVDSHYLVFAFPDTVPVTFLQFDLTRGYRRNERYILGTDELLGGRRRTRGMWIPAPEIEFAYLLAKRVLKRSMTPADFRRFEQLFAEAPLACSEFIGRFWREPDATRVRQAIADREWSEVADRLDHLAASLLRAGQHRAVFDTGRFMLADTARLLRRTRDVSTVSVAVLGQDGVGKSTAIAEARAVLAGAFRTVEVKHFGPMIGRRRRGGVSRPHAQTSRSGPALFVKTMYLSLDFWIGRGLISVTRGRSRLLIFDRYAPDVAIDPERYRYPRSSRLPRLLARLSPHADVSVVLDASPSSVVGRVAETNHEMARWLRKRYLAYADLNQLPIVNGDQEPSAVAADLARAIVSECIRRRGA